MSAWLGGLELNEITINHYSGWFLTLRSCRRGKATILHWQLMFFFPVQSPPYLHPMLAARNSCLSFSDRFLARSFPPHSVWQDYEVPKPQASFCFEAWKLNFILIILSLLALPLLQPSCCPPAQSPSIPMGTGPQPMDIGNGSTWPTRIQQYPSLAHGWVRSAVPFSQGGLNRCLRTGAVNWGRTVPTLVKLSAVLW